MLDDEIDLATELALDDDDDPDAQAGDPVPDPFADDNETEG